MVQSILYLNTHLFRGTFVAAFYRKLQYKDEIRCEQICDYIKMSDYNIIILSEVWSNYMKNKIAEKLSVVYPFQIIPKKKGAFYKVGPEHVILSKSPITEFASENLKNLSGWDRMSIKQICGFVVKDVYICTSHFDTGCMMQNMEQLKKFVQNHSNGRNVIVAGDLNIKEVLQTSPAEHSEKYNKMINCFAEIDLRDSVRQLFQDFIIYPSYTVDHINNSVAKYFSGGGTTKARLDYFFSKGIQPIDVNVIISALSDHYGITLIY